MQGGLCSIWPLLLNPALICGRYREEELSHLIFCLRPLTIKKKEGTELCGTLTLKFLPLFSVCTNNWGD